MKKQILALLSIAVMMLVLCVACDDDNPDNPENLDNPVTFTLEVTDDNGEVTLHEIETVERTVGAALLEVGLIEGDETEFGLYIKTVDGLTADFDINNAYWAFYIDGEFAMTGADSTNIEEDTTYAFVYTKD